MKQFYKEFFQIPEDGKIRDKVMLMRVCLAIVVVVGCLVAMSFSAYAYFCYNLTSGTSTIKAAEFFVDVTVTDANNLEQPVLRETDLKKGVQLAAGETYTVTLKKSGTASTGFCVVTAADCEKTYHTQQLGVDGEKTRQSITFTLSATQDTTVWFTAAWGTSSQYNGQNTGNYISQDNTLQLVITRQTPVEATPTEPAVTEPAPTTEAASAESTTEETESTEATEAP